MEIFRFHNSTAVFGSLYRLLLSYTFSLSRIRHCCSELLISAHRLSGRPRSQLLSGPYLSASRGSLSSFVGLIFSLMVKMPNAIRTSVFLSLLCSLTRKSHFVGCDPTCLLHPCTRYLCLLISLVGFTGSTVNILSVVIHVTELCKHENKGNV